MIIISDAFMHRKFFGEKMAKMTTKKHEMDMCNGPLLKQILIFTMPLMASGILQLLFNAADMVVAGRYAGSIALGAVGATSSLINLIINVFMGLSVGANVVIAHFYGADSKNDVFETVHTAIALAGGCGLFLLILGYFISGPALIMMATPAEILPHSTRYMQVYFLGVPMLLLYNFGAAILRAVGDTGRPLFFLIIAGIINVILNVIFVKYLGLGVMGVALATVMSEAISAFLVIRALMNSDGAIKLSLRNVKIYKDKVSRIARIGLPAGFQGAVFSISNVLIQSSVNSFGAVAVAGNTAAMSLEGFVYNAMNSFHQTAISFTGQNMGARKYDRVKRIALLCILCAAVTGIILGGFCNIFSNQLLSLYNSEPEVVGFGQRRIVIIMSTYFLCGIMDAIVGSLRGMGYSVMPMIVSLLGACAFRIVWIYTVFAATPTPECLYVSYPLSWTITFLVHLCCYFLIANKRLKTR